MYHTNTYTQGSIKSGVSTTTTQQQSLYRLLKEAMRFLSQVLEVGLSDHLVRQIQKFVSEQSHYLLMRESTASVEQLEQSQSDGGESPREDEEEPSVTGVSS